MVTFREVYNRILFLATDKQKNFKKKRVVDVTGQNREVITGSDFKRMLSGAYSEFLLDYEDLNGLRGMGQLPGTHILHAIGAAIMSR